MIIHFVNKDMSYVSKAAELRRISVSEYVRKVAVEQAKREVNAMHDPLICMTRDEQLTFWNALKVAPKLTPAQRRLAAAMRGES